MKYAQQTNVSSEQSRLEIEQTLKRYGATAFMYAWQEGSAVIMFEMSGRNVRFVLPMPNLQDDDFQKTPTGRRRTKAAAGKEYEQAKRQRWRALALVIKAKLEAVESGITSFEEEFLSSVMLPGNVSVGQWLMPQVDEAYRTGQMPKLLPMLTDSR